MRVLLVEDEAAFAQTLELMLRSEAFEVVAAALGEEGLRLAKADEHDIIVLDLNLPDMSGYEVLRSLRLSRVKTPVLILSGLNGIGDKVKGLGFGADDYLTKALTRTNWSPEFTRLCGVPLRKPKPSCAAAIWPCAWVQKGLKSQGYRYS